MRQLLALTAREITDRRVFVWATLATALLPWVLDLLPGHGHGMRELLQGLVAVAWPVGLSLGLGASVVADDVAHGRLSFYLSRPCSALVIWGAKIGAALVLALGSLVLLLAVYSLTAGSLADDLPPPSAVVGWLAVWIVATTLVGNAVAVAARSRDGLFGWDLVVGLVLAGLAATLVTHVVLAGAPFLARELVQWGAAAFVVGAGAGGLVQISAGRGSARRGHLFLSGTVWGTLGASLLVAAGFSHWVLNPSPWDTGAIASYGSASADGRFVVFFAPDDGGRPGFHPGFLVDLSTGTHRILPGGWPWSAQPSRVSADGRVAVSVATSLVGRTLTARRLDEPGWPAREQPISAFDSEIVGLSPNGETALVWHDGGVDVWTLDTMRLVSRVAAPSARFVGCAFLGTSNVRLASLDPSRRAAIRDLDVARGTTREVAHVDGVARIMSFGREGGLILTERGDLATWRSTGTQTLLGGLPPARLSSPRGTVLADGRPVVLLPGPSGFRLMTWDAGGRPAADIVLPPGVAPPAVFGQTPRGWMALGVAGGARTLFIDPATGRIERDVPDLAPLGDPAAGIYVDRQHQLVRFDPSTGSRTVVLPVRRANAS